jgi:hypothetical protein
MGSEIRTAERLFDDNDSFGVLVSLNGDDIFRWTESRRCCVNVRFKTGFGVAASIDETRRSVGMIKDRRGKTGAESASMTVGADPMGLAVFRIGGSAGLDRGDGLA